MFASSSTYVLIAISLAAVVLLATMLWRIERLDVLSANGLALIFGGALGNVYDRVAFGRVTDFLDLLCRYGITGIPLTSLTRLSL